jgi:hypothetical protein
MGGAAISARATLASSTSCAEERGFHAVANVAAFMMNLNVSRQSLVMAY